MIAFDAFGSLFHVTGMDHADSMSLERAPEGEFSALACLNASVSGDFGWVPRAIELWPSFKSRALRADLQVLLPHVMSSSQFTLLRDTVAASSPDDAEQATLVDMLIRGGEVGALRLCREEIDHLGTDSDEALVLSQTLVIASRDPRVLAPNPFHYWDPVRHDKAQHLHAEWRRVFDDLLAELLTNLEAGSGVLLGKPLDLESVIRACLDEILPARLGYRFVEIRPYLEAATGFDLSRCFVGDQLDQNLARHELEVLHEQTDFNAFEVGARYFFGHRLHD
jgi:hypothetical protein